MADDDDDDDDDVPNFITQSSNNNILSIKVVGDDDDVQTNVQRDNFYDSFQRQGLLSITGYSLRMASGY